MESEPVPSAAASSKRSMPVEAPAAAMMVKKEPITKRDSSMKSYRVSSTVFFVINHLLQCSTCVGVVILSGGTYLIWSSVDSYLCWGYCLHKALSPGSM